MPCASAPRTQRPGARRGPLDERVVIADAASRVAVEFSVRHHSAEGCRCGGSQRGRLGAFRRFPLRRLVCLLGRLGAASLRATVGQGFRGRRAGRATDSFRGYERGTFRKLGQVREFLSATDVCAGSAGAPTPESAESVNQLESQVPS